MLLWAKAQERNVIQNFQEKSQQIWKWICVVVHKQIYNEIYKQEKEKRKFDGKRVMTVG